MNIKDDLKKLAAETAVAEIKSGMIVGLGTGSTVKFALEKISDLLKMGTIKNIIGIPTSLATEKHAGQLGIPLGKMEDYSRIDLTIDGADEVDEELNLIKGGGGALLREKIVAQASKKVLIIVDDTKVSKRIGEKWAVPIEVIKFALTSEMEFLSKRCTKVDLRLDEKSQPCITDEGNFILDANFGRIENPGKLSLELNQRAGIVENGLFVGIADKVIIASENGIREFTRL
ncbi:MAG: ribose-5-phosphate isomerase RpiA [Bacteroidetes bacterium]|nr:ribose-5-phosphate isomerase RpiA [Bacteroidota bacterium]MBU2507418.1 ribose-5-phosphate isomerase RpiA [Bacteroidota bacterium]